MKRLTLVSLLTIFIVGTAQAVPTVEENDLVYVNEYIYVWDPILGIPIQNPDAVWSHSNPYTGDYDAALASGCIDSVNLTINSDCSIEPSDDFVAITFTDADGINHLLPGYLNKGDTIYTLNKEWLDGVAVTAAIDYTNSYSGDFFDDVLIVCSNLTVTSHCAPCAPIPAPGAILLGSIGVGLVGWLRKRRTL